MPRYIAFLRAINVGGHTVKMDRLRALFAELGLSNVETFIASGNVIFDARTAKAAALEPKIERHLLAALGYEVATFRRTPEALATAAERQPFAPAERDQPANRLYVAFTRAPSPDSVQRLLAARNGVDDLAIEGCEVYWLVRGALAPPNYAPPPLEKLLGQPLTVRNLTTVRKLAAKYPPAKAT
jgi:uncharacterized protein (DUF1697 family)